MNSSYSYFFLLSFCLLFSCSKNEEPANLDISGTFIADELRYNCSDRDDFSLLSMNNGVCFEVEGGQNCLSISLVLNEDETYILTTITTQIRGSNGGFQNSSNNTDKGTYIITDKVLTLCTDNNCTSMQIVNKNEINWLAVSGNSCDGSYVFIRN